MKNLILVVMAFMMVGCASTRTRYSDPVMRVMIDPDSIKANEYVRLQAALVQSGKWEVVDRGMAYRALKKEQDRQHVGESGRFGDEEKYARWGELFGVGGIVVARSQCEVAQSSWSGKPILRCLQFLSVVDARTGEVITAVEGESNDGKHFYGQTKVTASWGDTVEQLNESFPEYFEGNKYTSRLVEYRTENKRRAIARKERAKQAKEKQQQPAK